MFGARKDEWDHFVSLGLTHDLLPVVSNPQAIISPNSNLTTIGKVPSYYDKKGELVGISNWTNRRATEMGVAKWSANEDYGICIQTRHLRALDVDINTELADQVAEWISQFVPNPVFRTRDNSKKFLFPFFLEGEYQKRVITIDEGIIEFLGNGQQFIAAGTHPSGARYSLPLVTYPTLTGEDFEALFTHIADMLNGVTTIKQGKRQHGEWLDIPDPRVEYIKSHGIKIYKETYGPTGKLEVECPWCAEHSPLLPGEKFNSNSTVYMKAGTEGYPEGGFKCLHGHCQGRTTAMFDDAIGYTTHELDITPTPAIEPTPQPTKPLVDFVKGDLISDTVKWIVDSAIYPQPELALLNTLAFAGAVFGRRYALETLDTRTNTYLVGIASTGSGKDHSRKQIKRLANAASLSQFIGADNIASGEGILVAVERKPSCLMMLDELGMVLESMSNPNAPAYKRSIKEIITKLFTSSSSSYHGGVYADKKREPIILVEPNLCIYGTTTRSTYQAAFTKQAVESGELNRFLIIQPECEDPRGNAYADASSLPDDIVGRWSELLAPVTFGELLSLGEKTKVKLHDESLLQTLLDEQHDIVVATNPVFKDLYKRHREHIFKMAMIYAIADNPLKPVIYDEHITKGRAIVNKSEEFMRIMVEHGMATGSSKSEDQDIERVYNFISITPVTKRDITRKFRTLHSTHLDLVIKTLTDQGRVKATSQATSGRPIITYSAIE